VTGAGRGIGHAIAVRFAQEGADLALAARTGSQLEQTMAEITAAGRKCLCFPVDITSASDVATMTEAIIAQWGGIDVLVNNAGIQGPIGRAVDNDADKWAETIRVNLLGPFLCVKSVLPHMIAKRSGKIINLSGGGATAPRPYFSAYGASKAAVVRLTETLAEEVRDFCIDVNAIAPGAVNTNMLQETLDAGELAGPELDAARKRQHQGGISADLAASLAVFLASSASDGLSGKLISAQHDDWASWGPREIAALMSSTRFTLRRIDDLAIQPFLPNHTIDEPTDIGAKA